MKAVVFLPLIYFTVSFTYNRDAVKSYADQYWSTPNHDCNKTYSSCSPYAYLGSEACGYVGNGGDSGNFVSQCIIAGGYTKLTAQGECAHSICGKEINSPTVLGRCLVNVHGWRRTCTRIGIKEPSNIQIGDVLIFHTQSCSDFNSLATIVTETSGGIKVSTHSKKAHNKDYKSYYGNYGYVEFIHYEG